MKLDQATKLIETCAQQMDARYKRPVFDEWAVIALANNKGRLLAYKGPRREGFQQNFLQDAGPLHESMLRETYEAGDFEFARHGVGTGFESMMVLGKGLYLICNNTVQSMDGIAQDPLWIGAQAPFVDLSEKFRSEPVVVARL